MAIKIVEKAEAAVAKDWRSLRRNPSSENVAKLAGSSVNLIRASFAGIFVSPFYGFIEGWKQDDGEITWQGFKKDPLYPLVNGPWNAIASTAKCAATIVGVVAAAPVVLAGVGVAAAVKSVKDNFFEPQSSPAELAAAVIKAKATLAAKASTPAPAVSGPTVSTLATSTPAVSGPAVAAATTSTPAVSGPAVSSPVAATASPASPGMTKALDEVEELIRKRELRIAEAKKGVVEKNNTRISNITKPPSGRTI